MTSTYPPGKPGPGGAPLERGDGAVDGVEGLSPAQEGFVLALVLGGGGSDGAGSPADITAAAARLGGTGAAACRAALAALACLSRAERARAISRLLRSARDPVPPGIERVHPGWLRAALEGEETAILLAVTDGLPPAVRAVAREIIAARGDEGAPPAPAPIGAEPLAELRRTVFASLVAMPDPVVRATTADASSASSWRRLCALSLEALLDEIARGGAEVLGRSLAGAPPAVVARAAARCGGGALADTVLARARDVPADGERDLSRALVEAAATLPGTGELGPAHVIGLAALAHRLDADADDAVRALAQRLPPVFANVLLAAHAERAEPALASAAAAAAGHGATYSGQVGLVQS